MGSRALSLPLPPSRTLLPSFHSLIHSLIHSPLIHSFTCSFTRLVIHSSVRWIIHALTLSHSYPCKQLPRLRAGRLDKRLFTSRSRSSAEAFAPAVEQEAQLSAELPCSCSVGPRTQPRPPRPVALKSPCPFGLHFSRSWRQEGEGSHRGWPAGCPRSGRHCFIFPFYFSAS